MASEREQTPVIRSDSLRDLLNLRDAFPSFRPLFGDIIQIVYVLDASAVQRELRWRLHGRTNATARSDLHELIDSGVVSGFAPAFLREEIEKYLPLIASQTDVSLEAARAEWQRVQDLIRFYNPVGNGAEFALVDPKDSPYAVTAKELDADFVRTADMHFDQMGLTVAGPEVDRTLRDYARSTSVLVTVKVGSGFAVTFSLMAFLETIQGIVEMIKRLPPIVKVALGGAVVIALLHPKSRQKLMQWSGRIWDRVLEAKPALVSYSKKAVNYLAQEAAVSEKARETIQSRLRVRGKQTALSHIRRICLTSKRPLTADQIAQRVLASGYPSRSKTFTAYVRRLLREDCCFVRNADGLWMLRAAA